MKGNTAMTDIPAFLKSLTAWLTWKYEQLPGEKKPRKVPYYCNGQRRSGTQGSPTDRQAMGTYEAAIAACERYQHSGVGIAMLGHAVTALDFDHCVVDGVVDPEIEALVCHTYAEFSPSGTGVRAFVRADFGDRKSKVVETFTRRGFVTVTGNALPITEMLGNVDTVAEAGDVLTAWISTVFPTRPTSASQVPTLSVQEAHTLLSHVDADITYQDWVMVGMGLHVSLGARGFDLWDEWSARGTKYPGLAALETKWATFGMNQGVTADFIRKKAREGGWTPVTALDFQQEGRFQIQEADTFARTGDMFTWHIQGVLPKAPLTVVYGASGSGKSFMVLDMAAAIVLGQGWRDREVTAGKVLYICAEGPFGFKGRIKAYQTQYGHRLNGLFVMAGVTPSFFDTSHMNELLEILNTHPFDVIILDTLAQSMPGGDENSGKDLGVILNHCKALNQYTGASIVLVHHTGKDESKGARGHSSLRAACDAELEVSRKDDARKLKVTKLKDGGADGEEFAFRLVPIEVDVFTDEALSSCVVDHTNSRPNVLKVPQGVNNQIVFDTIINLCQVGDCDRVPIGRVMDAAGPKLPMNGRRDTTAARFSVVTDCLDKLKDAGFIALTSTGEVTLP